VLRGGNSQSGCMTFGRAMPGVTCTQWPGPQGCHGNLPVNSIRVGTGESCTFYTDANCSRDPTIVHRVNSCESNEGAGWGSFKCVSACPGSFQRIYGLLICYLIAQRLTARFKETTKARETGLLRLLGRGAWDGIEEGVARKKRFNTQIY
jgi:hypothetical protein